MEQRHVKPEGMRLLICRWNLVPLFQQGNNAGMRGFLVLIKYVAMLRQARPVTLQLQKEEGTRFQIKF